MICLAINERTKKLGKQLGFDARSWENVRQSKNLEEIAVFRDTSIFEMNYLKYIKKIKNILLIQEGIIPFDTFDFNRKSQVRHLMLSLGKWGPLGSKPYFHSADTIIALKNQKLLPNLEKRVVQRYDKSLFKCDKMLSSDVNIYFGTDFHRIGLIEQHQSQVKSFCQLKLLDETLLFRPHPSERELFLQNSIIPIADLDLDEMRVPKISYGSLSTALLEVSLLGSAVNFDDTLGKLVCDCYNRNLKPFLNS